MEPSTVAASCASGKTVPIHCFSHSVSHIIRMKILPTFLVPALLATFAITAGAESVQQLLSDAQSAYLRGDMETARRNFELVNKVDPRNMTAIAYLRTMKAREVQAGAGAVQEKQLATVVLPKVEFKEATLGSALDFLKQQVDKQSGGKQLVNFVLQLPDEQVKAQTVTLSLANVPFTEVLRYIGTLTNTSFTFEKYAIAVRPASAKTPATASATEPAKP